MNDSQMSRKYLLVPVDDVGQKACAGCRFQFDMSSDGVYCELFGQELEAYAKREGVEGVVRYKRLAHCMIAQTDRCCGI